VQRGRALGGRGVAARDQDHQRLAVPGGDDVDDRALAMAQDPSTVRSSRPYRSPCTTSTTREIEHDLGIE
jgi:hypothetical protein